MTKQRRRFLYLSGPVDAMSVYNSWAKETALEYFGTSYLKQFYRICRDYRADGYVITTLPGARTRQRIGNILIENHPEPIQLTGIRYHIAHCIWILRMLPSIIRFQPTIGILTAGFNYWILLLPLKLFGVIIIAAIHDSLWKRFGSLPLSSRILSWLTGVFISSTVTQVMVAAPTTAAQLRSLIPKHTLEIEIFLPTYQHEQFAFFSPPQFDNRKFRVLFMGRIETNKGVYDLLKIASLIGSNYQFDVCGEGSQLDPLRIAIQKLFLDKRIICHGFVNRNTLSSLMNQAHVVIVPTTTDFEEGFNMVCAEAVLAGRPVITSAVCPALSYIKDAAIEVPPNDIDAYCSAITRLATDRELYEEKRQACGHLQAQFYELEK